jgi:hypothetical protein
MLGFSESSTNCNMHGDGGTTVAIVCAHGAHTLMASVFETTCDQFEKTGITIIHYVSPQDRATLAVDESCRAEVVDRHGGASEPGDATPAAAVVDVNSADLAELMTLPGIDEAKARAIIDNIRNYGPYLELDELAGDAGVLTPSEVEALRGRAVTHTGD